MESLEDTEESNTSCDTNMEEDADDEINMALESGDDTDEDSEASSNSDLNNEIDIESEVSQEGDENNEPSDNSCGSEMDDELNEEGTSLSQRTIEALENGECNIDSHEFGEQLQESVGLDDNLLDSFMDTALNEMISDSTNFARGYTPSDAMETQNRIEKRKSHKDWKKIFNKKMRNFLTNSLRYREPNKSRQHPIYPDDLDLYGYSPGKKPKLAVVLDVSGSVDDKLLITLMSEIQAIQKKYSIKNVTLVQVDAQIKSIEKFGSRDKFIVRHGGGGTIMEPGFEALLKQSSREIPDMIICATDGDIEENFERVKLPNKVQVVWLVKKEGRLLFDTSKYSKQQMSVIKFSE
jgi:predicted metal-dependent peptidase